MQASVLQRKAIVKVAGGLGVLWDLCSCCAGPPAPEAWSLTLDKRAEDTEAACTGLTDITHGLLIDGSEGSSDVATTLGSLKP